MKMRTALFTIVLAFTVLVVACAPQDTDNEPANATTTATVSVESTATTEEASEIAMTPTGAAESNTSVPGVSETATTTSSTVESSTPAPGTEGTVVIPQTGAGVAGTPDDLDEIVRVLRETGATVEFGDTVMHELLSVPGQIIRINGEEVQIFTFSSVEELEAQASQVSDEGDPEDEPHFYKLGNMLVRYIGNNPGVRDLLEDVLGAQVARQ